MAKKTGRRGRPPLYWSSEELAEKIGEYFEMCLSEGRPMTMAGMAYHLGFMSRQSIWDYCNKNDNDSQFAYTLKRAKLRIEQDRSERLVASKGPVHGLIFDLKMNFGWRDRKDVNVSAGQRKGQAAVEGVREVSWEEWRRMFDEQMGRGRPEVGD